MQIRPAKSFIPAAEETCRLALKLSPGFPKVESFIVNFKLAIGAAVFPEIIVSKVEVAFTFFAIELNPLPTIFIASGSPAISTKNPSPLQL